MNFAVKILKLGPHIDSFLMMIMLVDVEDFFHMILKFHGFGKSVKNDVNLVFKIKGRMSKAYIVFGTS